MNRITHGTALVGGLHVTDAVEASSFVFGAGLVQHVKRISIDSTPTGAEQDTGWDFPDDAILLDVLVYVREPEATGTTKTLDIGLKSGESGGDADGFADGIPVETAGWVRPGATITAGATENYVSAITRGAFLAPHAIAGSNTAGDVGTYVEMPFLTSSVTAKSLTYTAGSNDFDDFRGDIYLIYLTRES